MIWRSGWFMLNQMETAPNKQLPVSRTSSTGSTSKFFFLFFNNLLQQNIVYRRQESSAHLRDRTLSNESINIYTSWVPKTHSSSSYTTLPETLILSVTSVCRMHWSESTSKSFTATYSSSFKTSQEWHVSNNIHGSVRSVRNVCALFSAGDFVKFGFPMAYTVTAWLGTLSTTNQSIVQQVRILWRC